MSPPAMYFLAACLMGGLFINAQSAPAAAHEAAAEDLNVRRAAHVELLLDKAHPRIVDLPASTIIADDGVNLIPGEEFLIEAEIEKGRLVRLHRVEEAVHPERTLRLIFSISPVLDSPGMMLKIENPFQRALKYRSRIMRAGQSAYEETSNIGVRPGRTGSEFWRFPIFRILLSDIQLVDSGKQSYTPKP